MSVRKNLEFTFVENQGEAFIYRFCTILLQVRIQVMSQTEYQIKPGNITIISEETSSISKVSCEI